MAVAHFYVHLVPEFSDSTHKKLKRIKASEIRQQTPKPDTSGLWIEINIEVPDGVFEHLVPRLNAKLSETAIEAMLAESSDLHHRIVGVDDTGDS